MKSIGAGMVVLLGMLAGCGDIESAKDWSEEQCAQTKFVATSDLPDADDAMTDYSLHC